MPGNSGGNARDNRQRGNAAQLLEKYKSMARDAQLAGDRVQTEYFLQFADHYFRVLEESRSRYEEQQGQRRGRNRDDEDEDDGEDLMVDAEGDDSDEGEEEVRQPRRDRNRNQDRQPRGERDDRPERGERSERPRRQRPVADNEEGDERISLGVLPPAIAVDDGNADVAEAAPAPRRRARKPRDESGEDMAPAA